MKVIGKYLILLLVAILVLSGCGKGGGNSKDATTSKTETSNHKGGVLNDKNEYLRVVREREATSSTGLEEGIAIPHGNPKFIQESVIAIATLKEPVDWGAEKVSLVFMLAVKSDGQEVTKQLFRELSFISEQPSFIQKLTKETNVMKFLSFLHT